MTTQDPKEKLREELNYIIALYPECFERISDHGRMLKLPTNGE